MEHAYPVYTDIVKDEVRIRRYVFLYLCGLKKFYDIEQANELWRLLLNIDLKQCDGECSSSVITEAVNQFTQQSQLPRFSREEVCTMISMN